MCLAPCSCFKGCTDEAYAAEVARVQEYFDSGGQSLLRELETERERLSSALDFEAAAAQHAKVAKIKGILSACDDICGRLDRLDAVIIQPSAETKSVALFRFHHGELTGPASLPMEEENQAQPVEGPAIAPPEVHAQSAPAHSMVSRIRAVLESMVSHGSHSAQRFSEELAILKRWYYRTHKVGEVFFSGEQSGLPWRRIVRGMTRVYRGEKEAALAPEPDPLSNHL